MPAIVDRGDLKIAVSTSGRSPALAGKLREYLDEAIPENAGDLTQIVGLLRSKLKLEIPGDLETQKKLVSEFIRKGAKEMKGTAKPTGKVFIVGAGPGADDLITLRALRALRQADVVFYDALISADLLDQAAESAECVLWASAAVAIR